MSNITVGASSISGFNSLDVGADVSLSVTVTLDSPTVTSSAAFRRAWVGLGGFKVSLAGVEYTVASVESTSSLTLTSNYLAGSGTVTATWRKYALLRVYVLTPFVPSGETFVAQSGSPGSPTWFRRYAVPVINDGQQNVAYVPQIVLPATTNSSVPTARYFAGIYGQSGAFLQAYPGCVDQWQLDADTTPTSWSQICDFNTPAPPAPSLNPDNYVTDSELNARLPSGLQDQLVYFASTGDVLSPLNVGSGLGISGGAIAVTSALNRVQEEGANLPQRATINFVGSSFTAADDAGNSRTNVTSDADLDAIASNSTNGIYARTGAGAVSARTITGPAAGITVSNGDGVSGNPTLVLANDLAGVEGLSTNGIATRTASDTWTTRTITGTANRIGVTNGDGVSGNPTLDIGSDVVTLTDSQVLTNKTLTTPILTNPVIDNTAAPPTAAGTNTAGEDLEFSGGKGTGTGVPGRVVARYPLITASGTTVQSLSASAYPLNVNLYTNTGTGTAIQNTTTETSLFTGLTGGAGSTRDVEGGISRVGTHYKFRVVGNVSSTASPTLRIRTKLGATTVADTTAGTVNTAGGKFWLDIDIAVNTIGASGTVTTFMRFDYSSANTGAVTVATLNGANAGVTVDTTATQTLDVTIEWSAASASNSLTVFTMNVDRLR